MHEMQPAADESRGSVMVDTAWRVEYLSRVEAAERCRIPVSSFDKLRHDGLIPEPDARMGKHLLWSAETIDELLARGGTEH